MKTTNRYQLDGGVTEFFFQLEHNTFLAANTLIMVYMTNSDSFSAARETRRGRKEGKYAQIPETIYQKKKKLWGLFFAQTVFPFNSSQRREVLKGRQ